VNTRADSRSWRRVADGTAVISEEFLTTRPIGAWRIPEQG
jgi:hypothetical protein